MTNKKLILFYFLFFILNIVKSISININNNNNNNNLLINNFENNNNNSNYVLFKPYGTDSKCLNETMGGLGFIILGNKSCIANNGISLTVNINEQQKNSVEICKYYSNNCKNLIACQIFIGNGEQCYDPFSSSFFYNSPIPASYTKMYILINNSIINNNYNNYNNYFSNETIFGYNFKQYSQSLNQCEPDLEFQYSLFITNNYILPNLNYPSLTQTFKCNEQLNIPQLLVGESIININQTCTNSNNLNNIYNYKITC
ncbi:hypothetical protein ACTFIR_004850 [Dictyostelium discoideum]